jgi:DNA invertase Pin-like site-specific DNA recombinase
VLEAVAERRGWGVVKVYEDAGISGAKGRDKRPAFDAMLKDALRRRFDVLMVWSIDRLGRSTATVAVALAELEAADVAIYADQQGMDATTPHSKAMLIWRRCSPSWSAASFVSGSWPGSLEPRRKGRRWGVRK